MIPTELFIAICKYLHPADLLNLSRTCHNYRDILYYLENETTKERISYSRLFCQPQYLAELPFEIITDYDRLLGYQSCYYYWEEDVDVQLNEYNGIPNEKKDKCYKQKNQAGQQKMLDDGDESSRNNRRKTMGLYTINPTQYTPLTDFDKHRAYGQKSYTSSY
ncbi:4544_t:CDS:2 [Rhizophagus irregularis]|nr:4544_t:CDS:2 [Rhizophagus irregularis]